MKELQAELEGLKLSYESLIQSRNKKLIMWVIRNIIAGGLIWYFWDKAWIKYAIMLWLVLTIASLIVMIMMPMRLKRKIDALEQRFGYAVYDTGEEDEADI
jgi:hypothetical protein